MTPTDSRPAPVTPNRAPVEPPLGGRHAIFRTRVLAAGIPDNASHPVTIQCPKCRQHGALVDRVGARIYGAHDSIGQCGWTDTLIVGRTNLGAPTLT